MAVDPGYAAEVRAEGRRLLAECDKATGWDDCFAADHRLNHFLYRHADVLLADPEPPTLTDDEREFLRVVRRKIDQGGDPTYVDADLLLAIIDRIAEEADRG